MQSPEIMVEESFEKEVSTSAWEREAGRELT